MACPMPLKHDTETLLVFLLGVTVALAGVLASFLPPLSVSVIPWAVAFAGAIAYPLALYPLLKNRRADYEFRLLHFGPAVVLFIWLVLELLAAARPQLQYLQTWYTYSWSILSVSVLFILLVAFCLKVIRQRSSRIWLLLLVFLPFIVLSRFSERGDWDRRLTARLWDGGRTGTGLIATGGASSNLQPSPDPAEEEWRIELRRMEERRRALMRGSGVAVPVPVAGANSGLQIAAGGLMPAKDDMAPPPHLPTSGFGAEGAALILIAAFCAILHKKTVERGVSLKHRVPR